MLIPQAQWLRLMIANLFLVPLAFAVQTEHQLQSEQRLTERINIQLLQQELGRLWVLQPQDLGRSDYIVEGEGDDQSFTKGDFIYTRSGGGNHLLDGAGNGGGAGVANQDQDDQPKWFLVLKRRSTYQDPLSGELLGLEVERIATAEQVEVFGDSRVLKITDADELILVGYRLIPDNWDMDLTQKMIPIQTDVAASGQIISKIGLSSRIQLQDVVAINLGGREGISRGHVLSVLGPDVENGPLDRGLDAPLQPDQQQIGLIFVLQSFVKMSYGVVMKVDAEIKVGDRLCTVNACKNKI